MQLGRKRHDRGRSKASRAIMQLLIKLVLCLHLLCMHSMHSKCFEHHGETFQVYWRQRKLGVHVPFVGRVPNFLSLIVQRTLNLRFFRRNIHYVYYTLYIYVTTVELRNRAAALELERNATKFGPSLSRSRSAQSLKLLGDTATQVRTRFISENLRHHSRASAPSYLRCNHQKQYY